MKVISLNNRYSLRYANSIVDRINTFHPEKKDNICKVYSIMSQIALKYVDILTAVRGLLMKGYTENEILSLG